MLSNIPPFRMVGNLYFVGEHRASSHMIDTGDGLILIDVGYEETADIVIESLEILGYRVEDVKYILLSHGHYDHSDGVPKIVARSGAKVFMFREDNKYLKGFTPDVYFKDGDVIKLGNTEILVLHTPGHTEGVASFFFNVEENGQTLRAAMFGGAGTNQLRKAWMNKYNCAYRLRNDFFHSLDRLRKEHVDVFVGNHVGQNKTEQKRELSLTQSENPFIDPTEWGKFLDKCERSLWKAIEKDRREAFVTYAHRGASEYCPENTFVSFYQGVAMGANGIETDVRRTKDGVLVLFHDEDLTRVCEEEGRIKDYTLEELQQFTVKKNGLCDKIVTLEDFLQHFAWRNLTFAIELKDPNVEKDTADLLRKYDMVKKTVVTSFKFDYIKAFKEYAPEFRVGRLIKASDITDQTIADLRSIGADEICPSAQGLTAEQVKNWHYEGFNVRAWGLTQENMKSAYDAGIDGTTANFPDLLLDYIKQCTPEEA
ncbi:MAG: MBL fold metallo-hydrolase [Clostridia bacterium]|nr:MBL fold metallo-hydrolase [Clostridia bacterium]